MSHALALAVAVACLASAALWWARREIRRLRGRLERSAEFDQKPITVLAVEELIFVGDI